MAVSEALQALSDAITSKLTTQDNGSARVSVQIVIDRLRVSLRTCEATAALDASISAFDELTYLWALTLSTWPHLEPGHGLECYAEAERLLMFIAGGLGYRLAGAVYMTAGGEKASLSATLLPTRTPVAVVGHRRELLCGGELSPASDREPL